MSKEERRILLDQEFNQAVDIVLGAFLVEGFKVDAIDAGDLHRRPTGERLRYGLLQASLPELTFNPTAARASTIPLLGCRLSVYEVHARRTLVTIETALDSYPQLASLVPRLTDRIGDAVRLVARATGRTAPASAAA